MNLRQSFKIHKRRKITSKDFKTVIHTNNNKGRVSPSLIQIDELIKRGLVTVILCRSVTLDLRDLQIYNYPWRIWSLRFGIRTTRSKRIAYFPGGKVAAVTENPRGDWGLLYGPWSTSSGEVAPEESPNQGQRVRR